MSDLTFCVQQAALLNRICNPLKKLGIVFFGYTACDQAGNTVCMGTDARYAERYLYEGFYQYDIHRYNYSADKKETYIFWDYVELDHSAAKLYRFSAEMGHSHTLTISRVQNNKTHCFHFSGKPGNASINQNYLSDLDTLHAFIEYFLDRLVDVKELKQMTEQAFKSVLPANREIQVYSMRAINLLSEKQLVELAGPIAFSDRGRQLLTRKELDCLRLLNIGKSAAMIGKILGSSQKMIEKHIANVKRKYNCHTQFQLGKIIAEKHISDWL